MHIYFSGIGGVGIGPLALLAKQAGHIVSGSDIRDGQYIRCLKDQGIADIHIGQTKEAIRRLHQKKPIDWFVYSSALPDSGSGHPELQFVREKNIKNSKRDELLNEILTSENLKLIAIAGTHGKTTTTAMVIWLFKQLDIPLSYSLGAKISFGDMGHFDPGSKFFVYECDEFDRNFLAFHPSLSLISGVTWDHHEIFPTVDDYKQAFRDFIAQSQRTVLWDREMRYLDLAPGDNFMVLDLGDDRVDKIKIAGRYNREDAWIAIHAAAEIAQEPVGKLIEIAGQFPGVGRRFEKVAENLYSDDAHTPEKIRGCMSVAGELSFKTGQKIVIVYEPLTNRRMHYLGEAHKSVFEGASALYWLPSYLAREDPAQPVLTPEELISMLDPEIREIARPAQKDGRLKSLIEKHLQNGDMVVAMAGGGAGSLDEWLRKEFA